MENTGISFVDRHGFVKGILQYKAYRHVNGEKRLIEDFNDKNLIVNMAREQMAHLIAGDTVTNRRVARISFGVNGTGADVLDEAILNPFTKDVDGYEFPVRTQVKFIWSLSTGEANGMAIREFGLVMANNALFARRVRNNPLNKESDISLEGSWTIIF